MSDEPIFSVLSGKTQQFYPNGFTVSGFTGGYAVYNGNYSHNWIYSPFSPPTLDPGSLLSDSTGRDSFFWNGTAWVFKGWETGYEIEYVNSTGGGDRDNFPLSGWSTPGGTLTFTAR